MNDHIAQSKPYPSGSTDILKRYQAEYRARAGAWYISSNSFIEALSDAHGAYLFNIFNANFKEFNRVFQDGWNVVNVKALLDEWPDHFSNWARSLPGNGSWSPGLPMSESASMWIGQLEPLMRPLLDDLRVAGQAKHGSSPPGESAPAFGDVAGHSGGPAGAHFDFRDSGDLDDIMVSLREESEKAAHLVARQSSGKSWLARCAGYASKARWSKCVMFLRSVNRESIVRRSGGIARSLASFLTAQVAEIRDELRRAFRPGVRVKVLPNFGIALFANKALGGGVAMLPIQMASATETLGASVVVDSAGRHGVMVFSDGVSSATASATRYCRWRLFGLASAADAADLASRIESAMVESVGGGRRTVRWPWAAAALGALAFCMFLVSGKDGAAGDTASVAGSGAAAPSALNALFPPNPTGSVNPVGVNGLPPGVTDEMLAEVLAGAGISHSAAGSSGGAGGSPDPWVHQTLAEARSVAQETIYSNGVVGTPPKDPSLKSYGLGQTAAGCDPALAFKVGE